MNILKLILNLTVDWEGEDFSGVYDLLEIRKRIGTEIPITHFICPNYLFGKYAKQAKSIFEKAILPHDEVALHIHNYRNLIDSAGVAFRDSPDFFSGNSTKIGKFLNSIFDKHRQGRGVPLSAYSDNEIFQILNFSKQSLETVFTERKIVGFRAGGWILSDLITKNLEKTGFLWDSSAAPPEVLSQGYSSENQGNKFDEQDTENGIWTEMVMRNWGFEQEKETESYLKNNIACSYPILKTSQPYKIGNLTEMPNNGAMSDYISAKKTWIILIDNALKSQNASPFVMNFGFHQEGDAFYKQPILELFNYLKKNNLISDGSIIFKTVSETMPPA